MMKILRCMFLFFVFSSYGQTLKISGTWCLNYALNKIKKTDTLILSEADFFQCSSLKFSNNGKIMACSNMKPANETNARTMECIWKKIGTWKFDLDILQIQIDSCTVSLQLIQSSNNNSKFIVTGVIKEPFKEYKKIYFYVFGWLGGRYQSKDNCVVQIREIYGFDYINKAADCFTDAQARRWRRHNKSVEIKLKHRWGDDWQEKLDLRILKCKGK
jgi:hypothetical protein